MTQDQMYRSTGGRKIRRSKWLAITGMMSGLALLGNYALAGLPNVELGSCILFVTAYVFGFHMAFWCTLIMSTIFGTLNPWGGLVPQIYLSQIVGWLFVVAVGSIAGRNREEKRSEKMNPIGFGTLGAITTLFFDLVTDLGYSWAFEVPYYGAVVFGLPFMVVHIVSNFFIFLLVVPVIGHLVDQSFKDAIWDVPIQYPASLSEG